MEEESHWTDYGITTGEELDAYLAYCDYASLSKDVMGWKDRRDWRELTADGWEAKCRVLREETWRQAEQDERHRTWKQEVTAGRPMTYSPFTGLRLP